MFAKLKKLTFERSIVTYGITGNDGKEILWQPVADLAAWLELQNIDFVLHASVARGLVARNMISDEVCAQRSREDLSSSSDILLSFGGDGTLLNSLREVGQEETPILGVNIGRLGFLTGVEVEQVGAAIEAMERGDYRVEARTMLQATVEGHADTLYAANEFLVTRADSTQMISLEVQVNGVYLNRYWSDGLLVATATGSTAYSLSVGGPIIAPGSGVVCITPIAPHTLTVRPIILSEKSVITILPLSDPGTCTLAADGIPYRIDAPARTIEIRQSFRKMRLVHLDGSDYFETLRQKLGWGVGRKA